MAMNLNCKGRLLMLDSPIVMGILNVTPDSFFDGGEHDSLTNALEQTQKMVDEGATIIDVGGMSSRPGAEIISSEEEIRRVVPVIQEISNAFPDVFISLDTLHSAVANEGVQAGANIINDISGGNYDSKIWDVCIENDVPYILMHMQGEPNTMQHNPQYENVTLEILSFLKNRVHHLHSKGLKDIVIDPGFGFGKTVDQNFELLNKLGVFQILDLPILVGVSRKSMINKVLGTNPDSALNGTTAVHMLALERGANILRVHDVKEAVQCIKIYEKL